MQPPKILFFTGGSALRDLAQTLALENPNTIHIVTTFDSGGSTAELRRCFAIPALGDIRNRMLALADQTSVHPKLITFLKLRCSPTDRNHLLRRALTLYTNPLHPFWCDVPDQIVQVVTRSLAGILNRIPDDFNFQNASIGNLFLTWIFLEQHRKFEPFLQFLNSFLKLRGRVVPIIEESLHLCCVLADETRLLGQHKFKTISQPIKQLFLSVHDPVRLTVCPSDICNPTLARGTLQLLRTAELICYPMGSFYSSVLANLVVRGVGEAVAEQRCPKVFIPNVGHDPELAGLDVVGQVRILLSTLQKDAKGADPHDLLNIVCIDSRHGDYEGRLSGDCLSELTKLGITVLDTSICPQGRRHDAPSLIRILNRCAQYDFKR